MCEGLYTISKYFRTFTYIKGVDIIGLFLNSGVFMSLPFIGITTGHTISKEGVTLTSNPKAYSLAINEAGAIPVLIPLGISLGNIKQLLNHLDGVLFSGGGDIETARYKGEEHPDVYGVDLERDELEIQLFKAVLAEEIPFMGICRGLQLINVGLGGTLYSHISDQHPNAIEHHCPSGNAVGNCVHEVRLIEDCMLFDIIGKSCIKVNSYHHQGVRYVSPLINATGHATDGLVEVLEFSEYPFGIAVQWHPEKMRDDPSSQALFEAFSEAAANYKN
jgi:putative glutamine amidotransferase